MAERESVMQRIQKLMERALHEGTPEHEAAACMQKADELMAQHMIDRSELTAEQKSRITTDTWDVDIWGQGGEYYTQVYSLLNEVLTHCNLRVAPAKGYKAYTVVGYPEDIGYAERMWFRVLKDFVTHINPTWQGELPLGENVHNHIQAGFKWNEIWKRAFKAGQHPVDPYVYGASEGKRLGRAYKKWLTEQGLEQKRHTQRHGAYRNSYATSFKSTIAQRLKAMREHTEDVVGRDKVLPARVSTAAEVEAEFYRLYPQFDPEVQKRQREKERAAAQAEWDALSPQEQARQTRAREAEDARAEARARRSYRAVRAGASTYDQAGWERGRKVAQSVNLTDSKSAGDPKKGIEL